MTIAQSSGMKDGPRVIRREATNRKETAMGRRLIATVAILATGFVGALSIAAPASASTFTGCQGPEQQVSKVQAESIVKEIDPTACLDIQRVDKCDGTTVVTMTNWAFNDNKFTVLTVELNGKEYTLKGGSDPNTETVTLGPPGIKDLQPNLVFRFTLPDGSKITIVKPYGDPWTWEEPKGCVSPSPSPSASATPSPSPSPSVSVTPSSSAVTYANCAAAEAAGVAPINRGEPGYSTDLDSDGDGVACESDGTDLPVTGASATLPIVSGGALLVMAIAFWGFVLYRRRKAEVGS